MNAIIFDLEFTFLRQKAYTSDILELGAVKLRLDPDGPPVWSDLFHTRVRPLFHPAIGAATTRFTGITQEDADAAPEFPQAMTQFADWLEQDGLPYYLCSWGPDDRQALLRHFLHHRMDAPWFHNYNDFQLSFTRLQEQDSRQRIGLAKALVLSGLEPFGRAHTALDDAFNTAKLFRSVYRRIQLEANDGRMLAPAVVYSTAETTPPPSPFAGLAERLGFAL
ncbi:exonuclease domain-containing protein [Paenibacillus pasadenensis]|uniref:3'-5' exonuclease n=1 Tax=Paenibacillus pasadenensis TaxID=217090 RepID=UPI000421ACE4|nr:3'-5' exonuclease [Paenibacillus pasadenensis]